jgi:transitional endoplasmic reticulum ATPase
MLLRFGFWAFVIGRTIDGVSYYGAYHATHRGRALTVRGSAHMDDETLQALIKVYKARASADLLSIIMDEAEGPQARAAVLELLRSLAPETLSQEAFAPVRRKACHFCLGAEDFELAERLARASELPEDRALRARALHALDREQEAVALYRQAIAQDPAIRNRDLERLLGVRPGTTVNAPAKVISLTSYSRRENRPEPERRDLPADAFLEDFDDASVTFADVMGLDDIKAEIRRRIVLPYLKPSLFERFKQKAGGNLLLYGPPGCGKTLIARATAGESDARFLSINPEDIIDRYIGEAEKRLRALFDEARSDTPAILFFDDFDVLAFRRAGLPPEAAPGLVAALSSELDGTQRNNAGVLIVVATNAPWIIDQALFRAGRFQRVLFVPPPNPEARKKILSGALANVPGADRLSFDRIVRRTAGYSGADLRALADWVCNTTLTKALAGSSDALITNALFDEGLKLFGPSTIPWLNRAKTEMKPLQRHESLGRLFNPLYRA